VLDPKLQARFTRSCTDAAFGYTAATIAAYADLTSQVLNFWADALQPAGDDKTRATNEQAGFPFVRQNTTPTPFAPFDWMVDPRWLPPTANSALGNVLASPFAAWCGMLPITASPAVWPMAIMLMSAGVPRSVAWPTAEANVAVMDAADAAAVSVKQVFASYPTGGGHAVTSLWPPNSFMTLAAFSPFNINAMMAAFRFA
jgi:hypothetical protein